MQHDGIQPFATLTLFDLTITEVIMMSNICQHGQLARQCDRCELETELARVTAERDELRRRIEEAPRVLVGYGSNLFGARIYTVDDDGRDNDIEPLADKVVALVDGI